MATQANGVFSGPVAPPPRVAPPQPVSPPGPVAPSQPVAPPVGPLAPAAANSANGVASPLATGIQPAPASQPKTLVVVKHEVIQNPTAAQLAYAEQKIKDYAPRVKDRFSRQSEQNPDGSWPGCFIVYEAKPINDGIEIWAYSAHPASGDSLRMTLGMQVTAQAVESVVNLMPATTVVANPPSPKGVSRFIGIQRFVVKGADVNAYLAKNAPQAKNLTLKPGMGLLVDATWPTGHHWGGIDRDGRVKYATTASVAAASQVSTTSGKFEPDLDVPYDLSMRNKYPVLGVANGGYQSHIESEFKTRLPPSKFKGVYKALMAMARPENADDVTLQQKLLTQLFGKEASDWHVKPVDEYWVKDEKGHYKKDASGYVSVKMFDDMYYDTGDRTLATHRLAVRMREVQNQALGSDWLNVKLWEPPEFNPDGSRKVHPGNVNNRVEIAMPVVAGTRNRVSDLQDFFSDKDQPINPLNRIHEAYPNVQVMVPGKPETQLRPAMQIVARRFKFDLENKKGLSIELSLDMVMGMGLDENGMPLHVNDAGKIDPKGSRLAIAAYGQIEGELNHMNLPGTQSAATNAALWGRGSSGGGSASAAQPAPPPWTPYNPGDFGSGQEAWLGTFPADAKGTGDARVHTMRDAKHPGLLGQPDYKQFVDVMTKFQETLLGKIGSPTGAIATEQKAAMGALLNGLAPMTADEQKLYADEAKLSNELRDALGSAKALAEKGIHQFIADEDEYLAQQAVNGEAAARDEYASMQRSVRTAYESALLDARRSELDARYGSAAERQQNLQNAAEQRKNARTQYRDELKSAETYLKSELKRVAEYAKEQRRDVRKRAAEKTRAFLVERLKAFNPLSLPTAGGPLEHK